MLLDLEELLPCCASESRRPPGFGGCAANAGPVRAGKGGGARWCPHGSAGRDVGICGGSSLVGDLEKH